MTVEFQAMTKTTDQPRGYMFAIDEKNQVLTLAIPFDDDALSGAPVSKGGKCRLLASSRGSIQVEGTPITLSMNVMVPLAE